MPWICFLLCLFCFFPFPFLPREPLGLLPVQHFLICFRIVFLQHVIASSGVFVVCVLPALCWTAVFRVRMSRIYGKKCSAPLAFTFNRATFTHGVSFLLWHSAVFREAERYPTSIRKSNMIEWVKEEKAGRILFRDGSLNKKQKKIKKNLKESSTLRKKVRFWNLRNRTKCMVQEKNKKNRKKNEN